MTWTQEQKKRLNALGFVYEGETDRWVRCLPKHDEFIRATGNFLYWFDTETTNGGRVRGNNRFPIMDFDALVIFLRALRYLEKEIGE